MSPLLKSSLATAVFAAIGLWTLLFNAPMTGVVWPQVIFFVVLLVNTFFSIRFYSAFQPKDLSQAIIDTLLVLSYILLAFSFGRPFLFATATLLLFMLAPIKYVLMFNKIPYHALLKKKIFLDSLGTLAATVLFVATISGFELSAMWALAVGFTLANIYLLLIDPMYKL